MARSWKGTLVAVPTVEGIMAVLPDYEVMLLSILEAILERFERDPGYGLVDTKLSTLTGKDRPAAEDPERDFMGKSAVYGWIQGRGLEALAGHDAWISTASFLSPGQMERHRARITAMVETVFGRMEEIRARGGGHLSFAMTPDGRPFDLGPDGARRYFALDPNRTTGTDLFYAKGMLAAARMLGRREKVEEACRLFRKIVLDVDREACRSDHFVFDSKVDRPPESGKLQHGWRMISILGFAAFAEALGGEEWFAGGERFIRHVIDHHVNLGQWPELDPYDFSEAIDAAGRPWRTAGAVLCDPGHTLEFVGLAAKFLLVLRAKPLRTPAQEALLARCGEVLPGTMLQAFRHGFNREVGGICDAFDLAARRPLNSDMPWWNLPETMRSAAELLILYPGDPNRGEFLRIIADCSNAFVKNFVNPNCRLMAYQTVDARGRPVDVIPATPDADPGYHTGLSFIDFMACIRQAERR
jgi:mannose/cellobiose epimerase-like protein (N-acyl-D-glucosamine 2-epimerase family)